MCIRDSAWSGRLAQKQAQSVPVRHSIRETDMGLCVGAQWQKSTFIEFFPAPLHAKKVDNTVILALEANIAASLNCTFLFGFLPAVK